MFQCLLSIYMFFFNDTATTEIYTLSLHDALPIYCISFHRGDGKDIQRAKHIQEILAKPQHPNPAGQSELLNEPSDRLLLRPFAHDDERDIIALRRNAPGCFDKIFMPLIGS